jgi:MFS family permease
MAAIAAFSKNNTGQNLSIYSSVTMIGRAVAPTVGGNAYDFAGYGSVYLIAGIAGVIALLCAFLFFSKPVKAEDKDTKKENKNNEEKIPFLKKLYGLLTFKPLLFVGILDACIYFSYGALEMVFPLYAKAHGISSGMIGILLSIQLVGVILLKPFFGRASDKFGRLPVMIIGLLVCAFSFFFLSFAKTVYILAPVIIIYGLGFALVTASNSALAADVAKAGMLGASLGIIKTLMDVGQTFGPPVIGGIGDAFSYSTGIRVLGFISLAAAFACFIWFMKKKNAK